MVKKTTGVVIPKLNTKIIELTLVGETSIISHQFSEKAKKMIEDKQQKKAAGAKAARDPEDEYRNSLYALDGNYKEKNFGKGGFGIPAISFKQAALFACSSIDAITKVGMKGNIYVLGDLVRINGDGPYMRTDMVRIGMGTSDTRYRGEHRDWWVEIPIRFNADIFSDEQIANLFNMAGFNAGVGDWRPSSPKSPGNHGMFHVATGEELKKLAD